MSHDLTSHDDELQGESNSISNQKAMLEDYAEKNGFTGIRHFTDDGISGTTFEREGLQAILAEVEKGNINFNVGEQTATVYTRDKAVMRKLDTLVADFPDIYSLTGQDEVCKTYSFPKSYISCRKPRAVSAEQRERARQMMIRQNNSRQI